jgi:hypothetical protein
MVKSWSSEDANDRAVSGQNQRLVHGNLMREQHGEHFGKSGISRTGDHRADPRQFFQEPTETAAVDPRGTPRLPPKPTGCKQEADGNHYSPVMCRGSKPSETMEKSLARHIQFRERRIQRGDDLGGKKREE